MSDSNIPSKRDKPGGGEPLLSFARGLRVIEVFSRTTAPQSMADIAKLTQLPRATVRRILMTLEDMGYALEYGKKYQLTPKILTLAQAYLASAQLPQIVQPILEETTKQTGEASSFGVLEGVNVIYVARSAEEKMRIMSSSLHVGSTLAAYCTSMGRAILSQLPRAEQIALLERSNLVRHTPYTLVDINDILKTLDDDRANGYSIVNQELELGLCSIAVPVKNRNNQVVGALNISTHALRTDPDELKEKYLMHLLSALESIRLHL